MKSLLSIIALVYAMVMSPTSASANDGVVNAVRYRPLPQNESVVVQAFDDSSQAQLLKQDLERELSAKGYQIKDRAPLIVYFTTRDQIGAWDSGTSKHIFSFETKGGRAGEENSRARLNVFDSQTGGLLSQPGTERSASVEPSRYRLEVSVEDRRNGKTYWRAWAEADLQEGDGLNLIRKMIPPIMQGFDTTVRRRAFPLN